MPAENGAQTSELLGYRLAQSFEVHSSDVAGITALSQRATTFINQGVPLQSSAPEDLYTKLNEVRRCSPRQWKTPCAAPKRWRGTPAEIGAVRSARQGVITARNSTQVSDYSIKAASSLGEEHHRRGARHLSPWTDAGSRRGPQP